MPSCWKLIHRASTAIRMMFRPAAWRALACSYSAASHEKTDYTSGDTDITVTYDGHSYLFSDAFICVDGKYYNPDLSVKQQLTTIYDSLTETAVSSQDGDILIEGED